MITLARFAETNVPPKRFEIADEKDAEAISKTILAWHDPEWKQSELWWTAVHAPGFTEFAIEVAEMCAVFTNWTASVSLFQDAAWTTETYFVLGLELVRRGRVRAEHEMSILVDGAIVANFGRMETTARGVKWLTALAAVSVRVNPRLWLSTLLSRGFDINYYTEPGPGVESSGAARVVRHIVDQEAAAAGLATLEAFSKMTHRHDVVAGIVRFSVRVQPPRPTPKHKYLWWFEDRRNAMVRGMMRDHPEQ